MGNRVFAGWYVVGAVFIVMMVNSGLGFYGMAVYLEAITEEQGWTASSVSLATSLFFVVGALASRAAAPLIERFDIRWVIGAGAVVSTIGLLLIGRVTRLATLYPAYVVFAIGFGLSGLVPATTLVTRWFQVKRSVALSIASSGLSVGGLTFTVLAAWMIEQRGMAAATPWLSLCYLLVTGVAMFALWPDPAARGELPDGGFANGATDAPLAGVSYDDAIRTPFFWLTTLGFVLVLGSQVAGIAHLVNLGSERVDDATGALLVSTIAGASVIARLIGGAVASRAQLSVMTAVLSVVQAAALWGIGLADTRAGLVVAAVLFGATIGNILMLQPLVLAERFGVANYPRIYSLSQLVVTGLGVAVGPALLGVLRDQSGYGLSYVVAAAGSTLGAIAIAAGWHRDRAPSAQVNARSA